MPVHMITGRGCVRRNAGVFAEYGRKCLIVTSGSAAKKSGALADVIAALESAGVAHILYDKVEPNPSLTGSKQAGDLARESGAQFVVGIGGGSALDAAKAAAVFAANDMDAMEVYKLAWPSPALPILLVGTTAGTGSEVASYAVMTTPAGKKKSFGHEQTYALVMFGDAGYTDSLPLRFTVSTALDALSHALEGYFSTMANELTDRYARQAVKILIPQLTALQSITDAGAITADTRDQLYFASIVAGFTLAKCGTCYCHCLGYFLSEQHDVPHGTACAVFLSDFLRRGTRLMPEKAALLYEEAGSTEDALCGLIDSLTDWPEVKLTAEEIGTVVAEAAQTKNFARTGPDGYTKEEGAALLTRLFL